MPGRDILVTSDEVRGGHLRVWDISNLARIEQIGAYRVTTEASIHNAIVRGNLCFMSYYTEGRITSYNVCYTKLLRTKGAIRST